MLKLFMKNKKGFTLVELMVVVVIIGILTAIAVPVYNNTQTNAKSKACLANIRTIDGAIEMFKANNNGTAPANLAALVSDYIKSTPVCPVSSVSAYDIDGTALTDHFNIDANGNPTTHK